MTKTLISLAIATSLLMGGAVAQESTFYEQGYLSLLVLSESRISPEGAITFTIVDQEIYETDVECQANAWEFNADFLENGTGGLTAFCLQIPRATYYEVL